MLGGYSKVKHTTEIHFKWKKSDFGKSSLFLRFTTNLTAC